MAIKSKNQKVVLVVGPTASGKTSLAVQLALQFQGEVISADSRQIYKGLDIGTAKVTPEEMNDIPHHMLDICEPTESYSAFQFGIDARTAVEGVVSRGHLPIVAGGTFFYVDAFLYPNLLPQGETNLSLREDLETLSLLELQKRFKDLGGDVLNESDWQNPRRVMRAIEILESHGKIPTPDYTSPFLPLWIGLDVPKEILLERYRARAIEWLSGAFEEEVKRLLSQNISRERILSFGYEYALMLSYIEKEIDEASFVQMSIEKNWQYAKRQRTWLKRNKDIQWHEPKSTEIEKVVQNFLG